MQWLLKGAHAPLKAMKKTSNKKVMALGFWDKIKVLVKYFRKGATMTGKVYAKVLAKLAKALSHIL